MSNFLIIRQIKETEISFLDKMLYNAVYVPPGNEKLPDNIIEHPEISKYIKDFGKEGDICFVAELDGELVGAIWSRLFNEDNKAYGYVDQYTPEIAMAVYEQHRKKGIGTLMMKIIIKTLRQKGFKQISLSVDKINYAYNLYKKAGFEDYKEVNDSMTMVMKIPAVN